MQEHNVLVLDPAKASYRVVGTDAAIAEYQIAGLEKPRNGYGEMVLTGAGTDNRQPAEVRITWTVRRNLLSWLEEVRPLGTDAPFAFRHRYTLTRAEVPAVPTPDGGSKR